MFINKGCDFNQLEKYGFWILNEAVRYKNNYIIIKLLIHNGAKPNKEKKYKQSLIKIIMENIQYFNYEY